MSAPISRKLVDGHDGPYIVEGNPDIGYTLHKVTTQPVSQFKRSWQAVAAAVHPEGAITS